jgi:hypothetical protein
MRRLILGIALVLAVGMTVQAQDYAGQIGTTRTLTNAQPDTVLVTIAKARPSIAFKYDIAKTSGTLSGTIVLQGRITPSTSAEQWSTINSYTITDATATNTVAITSNNYVYYRIITTPGSSQVAVYRKWLLYRGY